MKKLLLLILIIPKILFGQTKDTTRDVLLNKDTLLIIKTTATKTGTLTYTYPDVTTQRVVIAYKLPVIVDTVPAPPPPPPPSGYQGFGALAVGGSKSTDVRLVANKAQFDAALGSNRTIKFTSNITFTDRVNITYSYLTIDANRFDVTIDNKINGDGISFGSGSHHCILTGVRVINAGGDGINVIDGAHDIVIDHCSSYGNRDGNIDVAGDYIGLTKNISVQYCFIGGGAPNDGSYSGASLSTGSLISWHHNLWAILTDRGVGERAPLVHCNYSPQGSPNADVRDNLCWKWGRSNGTGSGFATDIAYGANGNVVNNYYYTTQSPENSATTSAYGESAGNMYAVGNVSGNGINANAKSTHAEWIIPVEYQVTSESACDAAKRVKASAGTNFPNTYEKGIKDAINLPGCN